MTIYDHVIIIISNVPRVGYHTKVQIHSRQKISQMTPKRKVIKSRGEMCAQKVKMF